jgi:hypothetical protein
MPGIWIDGRGGNSGVPEFTITDNQISGASSTGIDSERRKVTLAEVVLTNWERPYNP